jgi:hypothetical protein
MAVSFNNFDLTVLDLISAMHFRANTFSSYFGMVFYLQLCKLDCFLLCGSGCPVIFVQWIVNEAMLMTGYDDNDAVIHVFSGKG